MRSKSISGASESPRKLGENLQSKSFLLEMAKSGSSSKVEESSIAPLPERWYNLVLGPSLGDRDPSSKFCTLRYEFKPASIDKSQPGSLHLKKDNTVSVEFQNNQFGKPRVRFEGVSEDYKENDAVLFFNGETFRLERLHRVVKRLRHVRLPGEAAGIALAGPSIERCSSPPQLASGKSGNVQDVVTGVGQSLEVDVEKIEINDPTSEALGVKSEEEDEPGEAPIHPTNLDSEEHVSIVDSDSLDEKNTGPLSRREIHGSIDINLPQQNEEEDEIANVDVSDNEPVYPGRNAADALRAQVVVERYEHSSSSSSSESGSDTSSSSGTESKSESGNGSSRTSSRSSISESESSEGDSVTSI